MKFPQNNVRAQAFHHQDGHEAQRKLALSFAGPDGRLATMEDIVDVRLAQPTSHWAWGNSFVTNSWLYYGLFNGRPCFVIAHAGGTIPIAKQDLFSPETGKQVSFSSDLCITQTQFEQLARQALHPDAPPTIKFIDLLVYENPARGSNGSNAYTFDEALQDQIIRAVFGRRGSELLTRQRDEAHAWLRGHVSEDELERATVIRNMMFIYSKSSWRRNLLADDYAPRAYPLVLERAYFLSEHDDRSTHILGHVEICASTYEQFGGAAHFLVGIRDREPINDIVPEFRHLLRGIKRHWEHFVEPTAPGDAVASLAQVTPPQPPYFLERYGEALFTDTRGDRPYSQEQYFVRTAKPVGEKQRLRFMATKKRDVWSVDTRGEAAKQLPLGANAILLSNSSWGKAEERELEVDVEFFSAELDTRPCYVLTKSDVGGDTHYFTQRIKRERDDSRDSPFTAEPHFPVTDLEEVSTEEVYRVQLPQYADRFSVLMFLNQVMPAGANAVMLQNCYEVRRDEGVGPRVFQFQATFYKATVDTTRSFRPLGELREDFDFILDRCQHLGLTRTTDESRS